MSRGVRRLAPGLRCTVADNAGPMTLDGSRNYLVGSGTAVLLDPGPADGEQRERIRRLVGGDREVSRICLTHAHPDHAGGAERLARERGAALAASAATLERLGVDGAPLSDGDAVPVDGGASELRVVETPGHSADHLCFHWTEDGSVFTGDLVLGSGTAMVGDPDGHMGAYLASLERLVALRPSRLYPGHGEPVDEAVERLEAYRRHRIEREEQILETVRSGATSVPEIRRRVYPDLPEGLEPAAEASVRAHLVHLREEGRELPEIDGWSSPGGA